MAKSASALMLLGLQSYGYAVSLPLATQEAPAAEEELTASDVDFTAIVALNNCSGSLVKFTGSQPTDRGMVLTNGHCKEGGFIKAGTHVVDAPSSRRFTLLKGNGTNLATLRADRIIYGTMTDSDFLIYRLTQT